MITSWEKRGITYEVSDRTGVSSHFTKAGKTSHKNKKDRTIDSKKEILTDISLPRTGLDRRRERDLL